MSTSPLLPVVNVKDLPNPYDEPVAAVGTVTETEVSPSKSGEYQRVHLTVKYLGANGGERTAHLRFNLKPEWLTPAFSAAVRGGRVSDAEAIQYRINVAGLWRSLFRAADLGQTDLTLLVGKQIGFVIDYARDRAGTPKLVDREGNDASPELRQFFPPADLAKVLERRAKFAAKAEAAEELVSAL